MKHKAREWKPKTFMSDCSNVEMKAVTAVFSRHQDTSLYLARQASVVEELVRSRIGRRQGAAPAEGGHHGRPQQVGCVETQENGVR